MAERILKIKKRSNCDSLIMLGDIKDSIIGIEPKAIPYLNSFINPLLKEFRHVDIIPGNHDAGLESLLPPSISLTGSRGLVVKDSDDERKIALLHGHAFPGKTFEDAEIFVIGHMHLILTIGNKAEPLWVRLRFRMNEEEKMAIIVPPFNELLAGYLPKGEEKKRSSFADFVFRNALTAESLLLDGTALGDPRSIREGLAEVEY